MGFRVPPSRIAIPAARTPPHTIGAILLPEPTRTIVCDAHVLEVGEIVDRHPAPQDTPGPA